MLCNAYFSISLLHYLTMIYGSVSLVSFYLSCNLSRLIHRLMNYGLWPFETITFGVEIGTLEVRSLDACMYHYFISIIIILELVNDDHSVIEDMKRQQIGHSSIREFQTNISKQQTMADAEPWKTVKIPPIVQELSTGLQEPPSRYVIPEQKRAALAGSEMLDPIPIINLSRLSNSADEVSKLQSALENWGLFLAVGHGLEPGFLGEVMEVTRDFFKLPLGEKQKYSNLVNGNEVRVEGYGNDMVVSEEQILDWCDRLYIIVEPESRRIYSLWPTQPTTFRDILSEYTVRCRSIANLVLENLAKMLNLRHDYFVDMLDENAMTYARLNYYPHCPKPDHVLGMKPHTDASVITIVFIDDNVSGLQLQNNGVWYNVPIVPNALLVNVGDVMEILSNGFFKSPVHRVVTNAEKERLSLVMFYTMGPEREIEPVSELVDEKRPRRYRKIKTKDYIAQLFETFARGTLAIDTMKI